MTIVPTNYGRLDTPNLMQRYETYCIHIALDLKEHF